MGGLRLENFLCGKNARGATSCSSDMTGKAMSLEARKPQYQSRDHRREGISKKGKLNFVKTGTAQWQGREGSGEEKIGGGIAIEKEGEKGTRLRSVA